MKRSILTIILLAALCLPSQADIVTFSVDEPLAVAVSKTLEWEITLINLDGKILALRYRWIDDEDKAITLAGGKAWQKIVFQDIADNPETIDVNEAKTEFSDIFAFKIRAQDVGVPIGKGLRDLVWAKFKKKINISAENVATIKDSL